MFKYLRIELSWIVFILLVAGIISVIVAILVTPRASEKHFFTMTTRNGDKIQLRCEIKRPAIIDHMVDAKKECIEVIYGKVK